MSTQGRKLCKHLWHALGKRAIQPMKKARGTYAAAFVSAGGTASPAKFWSTSMIWAPFAKAPAADSLVGVVEEEDPVEESPS